MSSVRKPKVAGSLYPAKESDLVSALELYTGIYSDLTGEFKQYFSKKDRHLKALIVPYTKYQISFYLNLLAYGILKRSIEGSKVRLFILSNSSQIQNSHMSILSYSKWATPIGDVCADTDYIFEIVDKYDDYLVSSRDVENEYAIEVQMPLIKWVFKDMRVEVVPVLFNKMHSYAKVAETIKIFRGETENIFIVCSNMSKDMEITKSKQVDKASTKFIENKNITMLKESRNLSFTDGVVGLLEGLSGNSSVKQLLYQNSGDIKGDKKQCNGYASFLAVETY